MYQALYRKWRPKTFDDVIGQAHVVKTLKNEVMSKRISHAYLFTGSKGTGKTSCAKILAKAINCMNSSDGNPCGKCEVCKSIEQNNMLDITEIDAASNNGVENIRSMREEAVFSPANCKYRVYIVDEVHMLSVGAFNAFLKILEEPPEHVVFILATTEVHKIPATIISRCQRFDFYKIGTENICKRLEYICEKENIKIESSAIKLIANSSDGAMRDALSILDQCANVCENDIDEKSVKNILGIVGTEYLVEVVEYILKSKTVECVEFINKMYSESKNMVKLCEELLEYFRDILEFQITGVCNNESIKDLDLSVFNLDKILVILEILQQAYKNMNSGVDKKIEMEITLLKLFVLNNRNIISDDTSEKTIKIKENSKEKPIFKEIIEKSDLQNKALSDNISSEERIFEYWQDVLSSLKNEDNLKSLYISLKDSAAYESGNYILIDSKNSLSFELLRQVQYRNAIKKTIENISGKRYSIGPYNKKEKSSLDLLESLINNAKSSGIEVNLN
ncbi:MAG: DNA polymerase III subunit gamma/tau [Clostridia bacterium]|nr:DNA polymerase III subunit gamma/tau [Clostridia bacterium]